MNSAVVVASALTLCTPGAAQPVDIEFDAGVSGWRTVLDGVMGGLSTGRITQPEPGVLRFSGQLSLENNGGFSQTQTTVPEGSFEGATGIEARVRGDGRTYQFDVRCSDVRIMAGSFQTEFETVAGEWITLRLPFEQFRLHSFGRLVPRAPELIPARIESIGVTLADKQAGSFQLDIDSIRAIGAETEAPRSGSDLASVAENAGLTTLLSLVKASGIELPTEGTITVLAPTNDAFAALPPDTVRFLTSREGLPTLRAILQHHIIPTALDSASLLQRRGVLALSGQSVSIDADALSVAGGTLVTTDVPFDGGVVHVIDRVLMPETRSVADIVGQDPRLATLFEAVSAAGLAEQLGSENQGPWTLLAPSNEAFAALGDEAISQLLADPAALTRVLGAHVIPSRIRRADMIVQRSIGTLLGRDAATFSLVDGGVRVSGASIVAGDIEAANGVIHIIDRVILPEQSSPVSTPTGGSEATAVGVAGLIELAIERGVPLFNDGDTQACAAIYEIAIAAIVDLGSDATGDDAIQRLRMALAEGEAEGDARRRAWIFRRALDRVYQDLNRRSAR